jgi:Cof subfamily protein (haloacid dehalogenase superfamily)
MRTLLVFGVAPWLCAVACVPPRVTDCPAEPVVSHVGPRFRAVYVDLDGTLLDPSGNPRPASIEALAAFRSCGGRLGIATGRSPQEIQPLVAALAPDLPLVAYNGALTVDPASGRVILRETLDANVLRPVFAVVEKETAVRQVFVQFLEGAPIVTTVHDLRSELRTAQVRAGRDDLLKIVAVVESNEREGLAQRAKVAVGEQARIVVSSETTVEVLPRAANKLRGIMAGLEAADISAADTIVFGDSVNDKEMLEGVPASMAMGNCHPEVCGLALARIGPNDSDAIARVVRALAMGPSCGGSRTPVHSKGEQADESRR